MRPTWTRAPLSSSRPPRWPRPSTLLWLLAYFTLNLTLTLYNKLVLNHFPFPYTLTALHALCGTIGSAFVLHWPSFTSSLRRILRRLTWRRRQTRLRASNPPLTSSPTFESDRLPTSTSRPTRTLAWTVTPPLLLFSTLYTLNIVLSNVSLRLVTVPFHQCVRASAPVFVVLIQVALSSFSSSSPPIPAAPKSTTPTPHQRKGGLGTQWPPKQKLYALIPIVAGVALATYGDYYFTWPGFVLTLAGTGLAALKTVVTGVLLGGDSIKGSKGRSARGGKGEEGERYRARDEEGKEEEYRDDEGEKNTVLFAHTPTPSTLPHSNVIYETPSPLSRQPQSLLPSSSANPNHPHFRVPSPAPAHHHPLQEPQKTELTTTEEDLLYPPHRLSPKAPFRFPSPLPSRIPSPAPVSQSSSSSSSSFSYEDANGNKRKRPLSLSAFHPGPIDDTAPSIPLPPLSPSTKLMPAVSSVPCAIPSSPPQPTLPSNANGNPGAGTSSATESAKKNTTARRSPPSPSFYEHGVHVHSPSVSSEFGWGDYGDIEGTCRAERVEEPCDDGERVEEPCQCDGERGKRVGGWNRGWKVYVHRSTPSRVLTSAFDTAKRTLRSSLRLSSLSRPSPRRWFSNALSIRGGGFRMPTYTPLQLLYLLSPLAFIQCVVLAYFTGELDRVAEHLHALSHLPPPPSPHTWTGPSPLSPIHHILSGIPALTGIGAPQHQRTLLLLVLNGLLAFLLNVASFAANKRVGPVGMSVAANTKQAMVVGISVVVFELRVGVVNAFGVGVALVGGGVYAWPG